MVNIFFPSTYVRIRFLLIASQIALSHICQCGHTAHTQHAGDNIHVPLGCLYLFAHWKIAIVLSKGTVKKRMYCRQPSGTWNRMENLQLWLHSNLATQAWRTLICSLVQNYKNKKQQKIHSQAQPCASAAVINQKMPPEIPRHKEKGIWLTAQIERLWEK